jgi:hypothetical protein
VGIAYRRSNTGFLPSACIRIFSVSNGIKKEFATTERADDDTILVAIGPPPSFACKDRE